MALSTEQENRFKYLTYLKGQGMASANDEQEMSALFGQRSADGIGPETTSQPTAVTGQAPQEMISVTVDQEAFERGWSTGGFVAPDHDCIEPGICEGINWSQDKADMFISFHSKNAASDQKGFWRGSFSMDNIAVKGNSRAGKLKDVLLALKIGYQQNGSQVIFPNPKGAVADCDWQTVEVRGKRERRIQGVSAAGDRVAL